MVLRWILAAVVVLHGLLHLLGFVKAFGIAELSALQQPITRPLGVVWLLATVVLIAAGGAAVFSPRSFWMLAVTGAVISQLVIVTSWTDARWGSLGNVIVLIAAVLSFLAWGPAGVFAEYARRTGALLAAASVPPEAVPVSALPAPRSATAAGACHEGAASVCCDGSVTGTAFTDVWPRRLVSGRQGRQATVSTVTRPTPVTGPASPPITS